MLEVNRRQNNHTPPSEEVRRKVQPAFVVKLVLAVLTIGLCVYTAAALVGVSGLNIFTVHSTLGSLYANTYRYAVVLSVLCLLAWIFWAVVLRGRRRRIKKP